MEKNKMRIYEASFNVLKKILKEKEPFNSALKIVNGKYKKDEISIIANLLLNSAE